MNRSIKGTFSKTGKQASIVIASGICSFSAVILNSLASSLAE